MGNTSEYKDAPRGKNTSGHVCIGLLAHVDAGKTTLAESMLYHCRDIRKPGRVDHKDAFLDTYDLERERGITIFSKQARLSLGKWKADLLDTPGHVDFSAEMERTLQVLDYAVLVIGGMAGVQGHVQTLWHLLEQYKIPVFLFVNKMDQPGSDKNAILEELKNRLDQRCTDFSPEQDRDVLEENIAVCEEGLLERYLESGEISRDDIRDLIKKRKIFPCWFGSALKQQGVDHFLEGIETLIEAPSYPAEFGARVYKIGRDPQGSRLTYMKITGGTLKVKMRLDNRLPGGEGATIDGREPWEEKADQIRIYSGAGYETAQEVPAGAVCAVTGLSHTYAGEGLGNQEKCLEPVLEPVLLYQLILPEGCDPRQLYGKLRQLEEEEPQLRIAWKPELEEIHVQVMGEVQTEILKRLIFDRFGVEVEFGAGSIVYKETIADRVEGVGHFEPLRHYAEVHLILEPGAPGSGIQIAAACSEDMLDRNWQRLILTHLKEKKHLGVLTGSPVTDIKITLAAGKAHKKHTEGGDFRQATYRAVRQGLRKAQSVLLEPVYAFRLEVPGQMIGRAMSDIQKMCGSFEPPQTRGDTGVLTGTVPASCMGSYPAEVAAYTKGTGKLFYTLKGYEPCHNAQEVIEAIGYDPQADTENPSDSVFCAHGGGFHVPWDQVEEHMHLESVLEKEQADTEAAPVRRTAPQKAGKDFWQDEKELEAIFERTYGPVKRKHTAFRKSAGNQGTGTGPGRVKETSGKKVYEKEYLLVDGYNIIFAWEELKDLAKENLEAARGKLADILCNYQGYKKCTLILVYDAYRVSGNPGSVQKYHNIYVVYTKEAETADQYIEKTVHEIGRKYQVTVATSDALEQVIILGQGGQRLSASGLRDEIAYTLQQMREEYLEQESSEKTRLFESMPETLADLMEDVRLGKKTFADKKSKTDPDPKKG